MNIFKFFKKKPAKTLDEMSRNSAVAAGTVNAWQRPIPQQDLISFADVQAKIDSCKKVVDTREASNFIDKYEAQHGPHATYLYEMRNFLCDLTFELFAKEYPKTEETIKSVKVSKVKVSKSKPKKK